MSFIETLHLIFKYKTYTENQEKPEEKTVLNDVSLSINKGDFVGILGHNGSGKSTLARQLTALLQPTEGTVYIKGMDTSDSKETIAIRKTAGIVFQNPDNQIIGNVVEEDVAFGPENLGVSTEEMWERIAMALEATGMTAYRQTFPQALSGGQKQKVAISGILAMEPECIVLDEPTAMLDPVGRRDVLEAIRRLNKEKNITIIYITHHIDEVENADYLYVMNQGKIVLQGTSHDIWKKSENVDVLEHYGIPLPFDKKLMQLLKKGGLKLPEIISTEEQMLQFLAHTIKITSLKPEIHENLCQKESVNQPKGIVLENLSYKYKDQWESEEKYALNHINLILTKGEYVAIIGRTGSGKSTLLQHLNGLLQATSGNYYFEGKNVYDKGFSMKKLRQKVALCFQYPEYQLFEETVLKDICFGPKNLGLAEEEAVEKAREAMKLLGLSRELEKVSPFSLSGGQKRRVALAGILAMDPEYLILDEPAAGLDEEGKCNLFALLKQLNEEKKITIILVSHDMNDVAAHAKRVLVMSEGHLVMDEKTEDVFQKEKELEQIGLNIPQALSFYHRLIRCFFEKASVKCKEEQAEKNMPMTVEALAEWILLQKRLSGECLPQEKLSYKVEVQADKKSQYEDGGSL